MRTGTLVALTPADAIFRSVAHIAVVAARPLAGLQEDPPCIDVFFASPEQIEIDPQREWLLVESRNGFYEGHRNVMLGLQMLTKEDLPLAEHVVDLQRTVPPPEYIIREPRMDCSSLYPGHEDHTNAIDVTKKFPDMPCLLDETQLKALQNMLGKRLSIVQGASLGEVLPINPSS